MPYEASQTVQESRPTLFYEAGEGVADRRIVIDYQNPVLRWIVQACSAPVNYTRNVAQVVDLSSVKKHLQQHQLQLRMM